MRNAGVSLPSAIANLQNIRSAWIQGRARALAHVDARRMKQRRMSALNKGTLVSAVVSALAATVAALFPEESWLVKGPLIVAALITAGLKAIEQVWSRPEDLRTHDEVHGELQKHLAHLNRMGAHIREYIDGTRSLDLDEDIVLGLDKLRSQMEVAHARIHAAVEQSHEAWAAQHFEATAIQRATLAATAKEQGTAGPAEPAGLAEDAPDVVAVIRGSV